jgi:hypothetical protein
MLTNLMEPGGRLGYITVVLAFLMAAVGLLGIVLGVGGVGPVTTGERIGASATGAIAIIGTVGLGLQPTRHFLGAALAVLGAAAVAMMTAWAVVPVLIFPATIAVVFLRARRFTQRREPPVHSQAPKSA